MHEFLSRHVFFENLARFLLKGLAPLHPRASVLLRSTEAQVRGNTKEARAASPDPFWPKGQGRSRKHEVLGNTLRITC